MAQVRPITAGTVPTTAAPPTTITVRAPVAKAAPAVKPAAVAAVKPATVPVATPAPKQQIDRAVERTPDDVGREALGMISYPWRDRLNVSINFAGARDGLRAQSTAYGDHEVITVFVRRTDTAQLVAVNIAHELGHLLDYRHLNDQQRKEWLQERGRPDVAWWTCDYCTDYRFGSGDFAEVFAAWQVGTVDYRSEVAPAPAPSQLESLSRFFR